MPLTPALSPRVCGERESIWNGTGIPGFRSRSTLGYNYFAPSGAGQDTPAFWLQTSLTFKTKMRRFHLLLLSATICIVAALFVASVAAQNEPPKDLERASKLIGTRAQDWQVKGWVNSSPVQLKDLSGKVVLIRWWTEGCPLCSATAPSLNEFYDQFHSRGLEVIGFYHHKSDDPLDAEKVHQCANRLGFKFPVAIDYDWQTLRSWWLDGSTAGWTSVSFLIDRKGTIRHIHPGGQYVRGDDDYRVMKAKVEQLLAEK